MKRPVPALLFGALWAAGEPRESIYRAGFVRRCSAGASAAACECVAARAFEQGERDANERKRLGFAIDTGALALWRQEALRSCGAGGSAGSGAPRAAPPSPEKPGSGVTSTLTVQTTPPGATVLRDDVEQGVTPARVPVEAGQKHRITVRLAGYFDEVREVEHNAHDDRELALELRPAATLRVTTEPPGATVLLGGAPALEATPGVTAPRAPREVEVVVRLTGYQPVTQVMKLAPGEQPLELKLVAGATLRIDARPVKAVVTLDGVRVGVTPLEVAVDPGKKHALEVSRAGWSTFRKAFPRVKPDERVTATLVDLELKAAAQRAARANSAYEKANRALELLQERANVYNPPPKIEQQLARAEAVMEKATKEQEDAEAALKEVEQRRASEPPEPP